MTHSELIHIAYRWVLRQGMAVAFKELVTIAMEQPDVIAFGGPVPSVVIEVKISRADFKADAKKLWRANPQMGMGSHRIYCAPEGLLKLEELPLNWGLLSVDERGRCKLTYRPWNNNPNIKFLHWAYGQPRAEKNETSVMLSALRRLQKLGLVDQIHREASLQE